MLNARPFHAALNVALPAPRLRLALSLVLASWGLVACSLGRGPGAEAGSTGDGLVTQARVAAPPSAPAMPAPVLPNGANIPTRSAVFSVASFDTLPGWRQDNLVEAWAAFRESCKVLERKPNWARLCADVRMTPDPQAGRALIEREFTLLMVQSPERGRDGEITGYYEPLLSGSAQRGGEYTVPVYGVPKDMYLLDWKAIPASQRKSVITVKPQGQSLVAADPRDVGSIQVDLRRFTFDALDHRLRVRLDASQGLPYASRADIQRSGQINAPVLAWVDDPVALYAMQTQGAGRIKLTDGKVIRLQYADQNGQPFKPLQVAGVGNERVQTRGVARAADADVPEHFDLGADASDDDAAEADVPLTRGMKLAARPQAADVNDAVNALIPSAPARPRVSTVANLLSQRARSLEADPSYVFFRIAPEQAQASGPTGALGVPLTAGRSLAVDPRVMPLGYPVFLDAEGAGRQQPRLQRLMFAQDTGGAIRGAVRADLFWGHGADAGRQARQTRHRGRMWVMLPHAEVAQLMSSKLLVRGAHGAAAAPDCLVADDEFCSAAQDADLTP